MNEPDLLSIILTLLFIMNPMGQIPAYLDLMKGIDSKRKKLVFVREMLIALSAMLFFNYLGEGIFSMLELSEPAVRMAGGIILFLVAIKILFPKPSAYIHMPEGEPFIAPLAIPWIAGPSLLATIMLFAHIEPCESLMLTAILTSWMITVIILMAAPWLDYLLSKNGLIASGRLCAMILVMIAIQRFMEGLQQFIQQGKLEP